MLFEIFVIPVLINKAQFKFNCDMFTHRLESAHVFNLNFHVENAGVFKVTGSHIHFKSDSISKTVLDRGIVTM